MAAVIALGMRRVGRGGMSWLQVGRRDEGGGGMGWDGMDRLDGERKTCNRNHVSWRL